MLRQVPATLALIALSIAGFLLIYLGAPISWLAAVTYSDFGVVGGQVVFQAHEGQYWRLVTPIFLHFGWLHIAFNCLWTWEVGALIERRLGTAVLLGLVLLAGVGSNTAQFLYSGPSLFGGMSGVVYALLGFTWVYNQLRPADGVSITPGIMWFMVGWLIFCMIAPTEILGFGSIANAAHLGGLVIGLALGAALGAVKRLTRGAT